MSFELDGRNQVFENGLQTGSSISMEHIIGLANPSSPLPVNNSAEGSSSEGSRRAFKPVLEPSGKTKLANIHKQFPFMCQAASKKKPQEFKRAVREYFYNLFHWVTDWI